MDYIDLKNRVRNEYPDLYLYTKNFMEKKNDSNFGTWTFCHTLMFDVMKIDPKKHPKWIDVYDHIVKNEHMIGIWIL